MKSIFAAVLALGLLGTSAIASEKAEKATKDIVQTAVDAGSFKTLATALTEAGLIETLQGKGPFTVFAPTDEAFAKIPAADLKKLLSNKEALTKVLLYHVVSGNVTSGQVVKLDKATTVEGQDVTIMTKDGSVYINGAKVVKADIMASNGIIHVIDTVIMPGQTTAKPAKKSSY